MRALSIKTRLFIYSILFCFAGLVALGGYSYLVARNALISRTNSQLTAVRVEKGKRVEQFFTDRCRDVSLLAEEECFGNICEEYERMGQVNLSELTGNKSFQRIINFLKKANCYTSLGVSINNGGVFSISLNHNHGAEEFSFSTANTAPVISRLLKKTYESSSEVILDFEKSRSNEGYSVFVTTPIVKEGARVGIIFLEVPDRALNRLMSEKLESIELGSTGDVYIAGEDFLLRTSSRFIDNSVLMVRSKTHAVEQALNGFSGTARILDYRGVKVLSSYAPLQIPNLRWVAVAEMDWSEALNDVVKLKYRILIIGIAIFLLLTVGVFIFSGRITKPIIQLKEAAIMVGEGKFDWVIPVRQHDEIGLLTQVFNKMTQNLKQTTKRLMEREQRLLHFYRATIDGILIHKAGKTLMVNRALVSLTGFFEEELLSISPWSLFSDEDYLLKVHESSDRNALNTILKTNRGENVPVEVQHRQIDYHEQQVEAMVIRDISERKTIEDELKVERLHRLRSVFDGQEQERQRLSRELHDGLGQTLVAIKLRLESIPLEKLGEQARTIEMVKQMFNHTIEETRRISNNLMPAALTEFSLAVVLRNLCNEVESNSGITVSLVVGVLPEWLDMLTKTYAYRIVQEALTNIVKHSQANRAIVSLFSDIHKLFLQIEDNGVGFSKRRADDLGNGIYNMRERASLLGGQFEVKSTVGRGTMVKVEFPITNSKERKHEH